MFQLTRLATGGSTGFEIAKSYYLNPNIVALRHMAVVSFFLCIPVSIAAIGLTVYVKLGGRHALKYSLPIAIFLLCASISLRFLYVKHRSIFKEKYSMCVAHQSPLLDTLAQSNVHSTRGMLKD